MEFSENEMADIKSVIEFAEENAINGEDMVKRKRIGQQTSLVLKNKFYCVYTLEEVPYLPEIRNRHLSVACQHHPEGPKREEFEEIALAFGFSPENRFRQLISNIPVPDHPKHFRLSILEYPMDLINSDKIEHIHLELEKDLAKLNDDDK